MRLVIIKETNTVLKDGQGYNNLNFHQLHFQKISGHYNGMTIILDI
jgi:hypothetical protein